MLASQQASRQAVAVDMKSEGYEFGIGAALLALIVACIGIGLYVGALSGSSSVHQIDERRGSQGGAAERQNNEGDKRSPLAFRDHQISTSDKAPIGDRYAAEERQRNRDDLVAQQVTATWTKRMGVAAIGALFLSILGVGLIYTTFKETQRAANAAHDANRPWVDLILLPEAPSINDARVSIEFTVRLQNIGKSPALDVVLEMTSDTPQGQLEGIAPRRDLSKPIEHRQGTLLPQRKYYVREWMLFPWGPETDINPKFGWNPSITVCARYKLPAGGEGLTKRSFLIKRDSALPRSFGLIRIADQDSEVELTAKALPGDIAS